MHRLHPRQLLSLLCAVVALVTTVKGRSTDSCKEIISFNVGLLPNIAEASIRRPKTIEALKDSTADFVCLQELWFEKDMSAVLDEVASTFPYHYSKIHSDQGSLRNSACANDDTSETKPKDTACSLKEVMALKPEITKCGIKNNCTGLDGISQGVCLAMKCADILRSGVVSETCISCLYVNVPKPFPEAIKICATPIAVHNRINSPGLVVLSKTKMRNLSYSKYFPDHRMAFERGYIQAELDDGKLAVCTHLTSIFPFYPEYDLPFKSYEKQSQEEIRVLDKEFSAKEHILVGDINTGPQISDSSNPEKNLDGEYPKNYDILKGFGYRSPYLEHDGRCTYCKSNSLVANSNNVIDQVMVKSGSQFTIPRAMRVFDANPPLSDHYGVQVCVCNHV